MPNPTINVSQIDFENSPCVRVELNQEAVEDYAQSYLAMYRMPDPVLFKNGSGGADLICDGRDPLEGIKLLKKTKGAQGNIRCEVREGGADEAWEYALGSNTTNGLRRTNADKRLVVEAAIKR